MVQFPVGVDNFRFRFEAIVTSSTTHAFHVDNTEKKINKKIIKKNHENKAEGYVIEIVIL